MEKIFTEFGVQWQLLIAQIVNFLILLFILKRFLYAPILKVLKIRKDKIAQSLKDADKIQLELQKTEEEKEKKLAQASKEAQKLIEEASKASKNIIEEAHIKASKDMEDILQKGKEQLERDREKLNQEIREELADLIVVSLEKVAGKSFSKKDQKSLVEKSIKEIV